jgi:hypothetical protein
LVVDDLGIATHGLKHVFRMETLAHGFIEVIMSRADRKEAEEEVEEEEEEEHVVVFYARPCPLSSGSVPGLSSDISTNTYGI